MTRLSSAATDVGSDFYVSAGNAVTDQANFTRVTTTTVSGNTLSLVLSNAIASTDDVSIDYDDPTITGGAGVQDLAGNDASSFMGFEVINSSAVDGFAPTFVSAATSTDGLSISINYDEALSATTAATNAFSVTAGGAGNSVTKATVSGNTLNLGLTNAITATDDVFLNYSDPTIANDAVAVQDLAGNDAGSLSTTSVSNRSAVDGIAPAFLSGESNDAGTLISLNYDESFLSTSLPLSSDFTITAADQSFSQPRCRWTAAPSASI